MPLDDHATDELTRPADSDPPSRRLLPFDVSHVDLSNVDALSAEALKDAVRSVLRVSRETVAQTNFTNSKPGTPDWSSFNSHSNSK